MTQSLDTVSPAALEVLSSAQDLFEEGRRIGLTLERGLQRSIENFYERAIPFAYRVRDEKPWKSNDYSTYDDIDPQQALLKFLRASFAENNDTSPKTAQQQAIVVWMCIIDGLKYGEIKGISFRNLLKMAYAVKYLSRKDRRQLLRMGRDVRNIHEFAKQVDSLVAGYHVEGKKPITMLASESANKALDAFDEKTKEIGDSRPLGEKLSDVATTFLHTEIYPEQAIWASRAQAWFCRLMRRREPALAAQSDNEILGWLTFMSGQLYKEEFDEESGAEYLELERTRPSDD